MYVRWEKRTPRNKHAWKQNKQKTIIDRYGPIKVYNADGTKFFFIVTSDRSLIFKDSKQKKVSYGM